MNQTLKRIILVLVIIVLAWGALTLFKSSKKGSLPLEGSVSESLPPPPPF